MHIEMGDGRYSTIHISTITFQRESGSPLTLKDVMYVPGLNKNLVSVAILEDSGYNVIFSNGKAFPRHRTSEADRGSGEGPLQIGSRRMCCFEHKYREGAKLRHR